MKMLSEINHHDMSEDELALIEHEVIMNIDATRKTQSMVYQADKTKPIIPPLDFSKLKGGHAQPKKNVQQVHQKPEIPKLSLGKPSFKLNLAIVNKQKEIDSNPCFQDEFMAKLDEYSESWREAALKEQRH